MMMGVEVVAKAGGAARVRVAVAVAVAGAAKPPERRIRDEERDVSPPPGAIGETVVGLTPQALQTRAVICMV